MAAAAAADQTRLRHVTEKPLVFIVSDISNEPDDAQSLVRLLTYANELDIQGLVACTSCWMRSNVHPEDMRSIVAGGYAACVDNMAAHVHPDNRYPSAEHLLSVIRAGPAVYGRQALADDCPLSEGAQLLVDRADAATSRGKPLWVLSWGGVNVLAQALKHVHATRPASEAHSFRSTLRVYTISDQDDCGAWIRVNYPDVLYICSVHAWGEYANATWTGISADLLAKETMDPGGPDTALVSRDWLRANIQGVGSPLGRAYPDTSFIMEGDTPTFLYLVQNGLGSPENPAWGSWGGRYGLNDLGGATRHYNDVADTVTVTVPVAGVGGDEDEDEDKKEEDKKKKKKKKKTFRSKHATIWRWREAYQNDFAARMQWTLSPDRAKANHAPVVIVNDGSGGGPEPLCVEAEAGSLLVLDASRSYDPDGKDDDLSFEWYHYKEPTQTGSAVHWAVVPDVEFLPCDDSDDNNNNSNNNNNKSRSSRSRGKKVKVQIPAPELCAVNILTGQPMPKGQVLHFILSVRDKGNGTPYPLTTYKRVVVQVTNYAGKGGRDLGGKAFDTVTEALGHSTGRETLHAGDGGGGGGGGGGDAV